MLHQPYNLPYGLFLQNYAVVRRSFGNVSVFRLQSENGNINSAIRKCIAYRAGVIYIGGRLIQKS